jgi:hypothetical protein
MSNSTDMRYGSSDMSNSTDMRYGSSDMSNSTDIVVLICLTVQIQ